MRIICIGDSNTADLRVPNPEFPKPWPNYLADRQHDIVNVALSGTTMVEWNNTLFASEAQSHYPCDATVINLGTVDALTGGGSETSDTDYLVALSGLVQKVDAEGSAAFVCYPPLSNGDAAHNARIESYWPRIENITNGSIPNVFPGADCRRMLEDVISAYLFDLVHFNAFAQNWMLTEVSKVLGLADTSAGLLCEQAVPANLPRRGV